MGKYYVYIHYKKGTNIPFYVGKGCRKRAYVKFDRNKWWNNIANKYGYDVEIVERSDDENLMYDLEMYWIGQLKVWGFELTNLTGGGNNNFNFKNPLKGKTFEEIYGIERANILKNKMREAKLGSNNPMYGKESNNKLTESERLIRKKELKEYKRKYGLKYKIDKPEGYMRKGCKLILDTSNGIYYNSLKEASEILGFNQVTLSQYLRNTRPNKTTLLYV